MQYEVIESCPKCSGQAAIVFEEEAGEMVCSGCGCVVNEKVEVIQESNFEEKGARAMRTHPQKSTFYGRIDASMIPFKPIDLRGERIQDENQFHRIRKLHRQIHMDSKTRCATKAIRRTMVVADTLGLGSQIRENAINMFNRLHDSTSLLGNSALMFSIGCLYISARQAGAYRSHKLIFHALGKEYSMKEIIRGIRRTERILGVRHEVPDTKTLVNPIAVKLGLNGLVVREALNILDTLKDEPLLSGITPTYVAGCALFIATNQCGVKLKFHRMKFCMAMQTDQNTLRNTFKRMEELLARKQ